jgi:hypothetical protein
MGDADFLDHFSQVDVLTIENGKQFVGVGGLAEDGVATAAVVRDVTDGASGAVEQVEDFADVSCWNRKTVFKQCLYAIFTLA